MSFLNLFGFLLHDPHPTQQPVEEEGRMISRRLRELLDEPDHSREVMLSVDHRHDLSEIGDLHRDCEPLTFVKPVGLFETALNQQAERQLRERCSLRTNPNGDGSSSR
jgi:hypothetical protein